MKTVFFTAAAALILLGILAVLDHNNDFSLTQRENVHKFGATYMTMNNPFFEVVNETIRATVESNGDILITRDPALDAYRKDYATECEFYTDVLLANGVAPDCILQEDEAQFTAENARLSRKLLDTKGLHPKKAIICCKGFHARRCLMYYQLCFPDTELLIAPVEGKVTRENWYRTEAGQRRVLGELARLGTQFTPEHMPEMAEAMKLG